MKGHIVRSLFSFHGSEGIEILHFCQNHSDKEIIALGFKVRVGLNRDIHNGRSRNISRHFESLNWPSPLLEERTTRGEWPSCLFRMSVCILCNFIQVLQVVLSLHTAFEIFIYVTPGWKCKYFPISSFWRVGFYLCSRFSFQCGLRNTLRRLVARTPGCRYS